MNERIKELSSKCWDTRLDGVHFDVEQFADLIIRECLQVCRDSKLPLSENRDLYYNDGIYDCILMIKRHFGVKL